MSDKFILAHGTSARHLDDIQTFGLKPRQILGVPSLWDKCPSDSRCVYLTNAYAFYFALNACAEKGEDALIVEVEVNRGRLDADEDYLGQSSRGTEWEADFPDLIQRTLFMREAITKMPNNSRLTLMENALENLGTVRHNGPIPASKITRIARVPAKEHVRLVLTECDPTITIMNYRIMGERYRAFQQSLFDRYPLEV